ncbi:MAG: TatD family hydrolase [Armatimonadetes bacterium]|nr:TatD family hydrolase [Armatimonadota bacterium]
MRSLIDTHAHLYVGRFAEDIEQVLARATEAGVEAVVIPATKPQEFEPALQLAKRFPQIHVAIGVHPHHAAEVEDSDLDHVQELLQQGCGIAVGEIGLDYHYDFAPRPRQHEVFRRQLRIAKAVGLPAVIHNRESDQDLLQILEEEQDGSVRFQLHCFSSGLDVLERAVGLGGMISFTGNITFSKGALDDVVRAVPEDRIMVETDAPYMTPLPHRGKRNEPAFVELVAQKMAELRGTTLQEIMTTTTANAKRFFQLMLLLILACVPAAAKQSADSRQQPPADISLPTPSLPASPADSVAAPAKPSEPYEKWFGFGGHFASTSIISGSLTDANAVAGYGIWLSGTPFRSWDVHWLQLDITYTQSRNTILYDTNYTNSTGKEFAPPNDHQQFGFNFRFTGNPMSVINLHASLGLTYFRNSYGLEEWLINEVRDTNYTAFVETGLGLSGSFGIAINIKTPYGIVAPTAEWYVSKIMSERTLPRRTAEFFLSQPRLGLLFYPAFSKLF